MLFATEHPDASAGSGPTTRRGETMACDCSCERCGERPRTEVTRTRRQKSSGWGVWKYVVGFLFGWFFFG